MNVVLLVSQRAPSTVRVIGSFTFLTRCVLAAVLDHHLHQLWNKNQNFEWHLEITKMNGHQKKIITTVLQHSYICVCELRNFSVVWPKILFALGVGGGGGFQGLFLDSPSRTTSPLNRLMTNQCIIWLVTYNNSILRMLPGYSINYLRLYIISVQ